MSLSTPLTLVPSTPSHLQWWQLLPLPLNKGCQGLLREILQLWSYGFTSCLGHQHFQLSFLLSTTNFWFYLHSGHISAFFTILLKHAMQPNFLNTARKDHASCIHLRAIQQDLLQPPFSTPLPLQVAVSIFTFIDSRGRWLPAPSTMLNPALPVSSWNLIPSWVDHHLILLQELSW